MFFQIDQAIIAGNRLKGKLVVGVAQSFPGDRIVLCLSGKETTDIIRTGHPQGKTLLKKKKNKSNMGQKSSSSTKTKTKTKDSSKKGQRMAKKRQQQQQQNQQRKISYTGTRDICNSRVVLRSEEDGEIHQGTYTFPFEFYLPTTLPTSMDGSTNEGTWKIHYELTVHTTHIQNLITQPILVASAPLPNGKVPAIIKPALFPVQGFPFKRGNLAIGVRVEDVHVGRGTQLALHLATRNIATASIHRVEIKLLECIEYYADKQKEELTRTLLCKEDVDNLPGIVRDKVGRYISKHDNDTVEDELKSLYEDLFSNENGITLDLPYACRDSYAGRIVRISHKLVITMHTKSGVNNPDISIPVQIGYSPVPEEDNDEEDKESAITAKSGGVTDVENSKHSSSVRRLPDTEIIPTAVAVPIPEANSLVAPMAMAIPEAMVLGGRAVSNSRVIEEGDEEEISTTSGEDEPASTTSTSSSSSLSVLPPPPMPMPDVTECDDDDDDDGNGVDDDDDDGNDKENETIPVSVDGLLQEMSLSISDYDILSNKLRDPIWSTVLSHITAKEFGQILTHVHMDMEQPRVAVLLAKHLQRPKTTVTTAAASAAGTTTATKQQPQEAEEEVASTTTPKPTTTSSSSYFSCDYVVEVIKHAPEWNRTTIIKSLLQYCIDLHENHNKIAMNLTEWEQIVIKDELEKYLSTTEKKQQEEQQQQ